MEPIRPMETLQLLDAAIQTAHKWEGTLASKGGEGPAERAFAALRQGRIELGHPEAATQRLRPKDFEDRGLELSPEVKKGMQGSEGYAYYIVPVRALLFPARGAQYRLLESQLCFDTGAEQRKLEIHRIFPEPLWQPVISWGGQFSLALNGDLEWGAGLAPSEVQLGALDAQLAGRVKNANEMAGFIQVLPFEHALGRMEIEAQFSSVTAMWRLGSRQAIRDQRHTRLVVLLRVPKEVRQIQIEAAAQAEVAFDWLTAQVSHIMDRLPEAIQQILRQREGLPLQDFQQWVLDLPR